MARRRQFPKGMPLVERLTALSERQENGCLLWRGSVDSYGYGHIKFGGKLRLVHRAAFAEAKGPIPSGAHICHSCDNRACIEPSHLWAGTNQENVSDKVRKGRHLCGELSARSKLTANDVREILRASGVHKEIGARYGISGRYVGSLKRQENWRHLSGGGA